MFYITEKWGTRKTAPCLDLSNLLGLTCFESNLLFATEGVVAEGGTKERIFRTSVPRSKMSILAHVITPPRLLSYTWFWVFRRRAEDKGTGGSSLGRDFLTSSQTHDASVKAVFPYAACISNLSHF